MLKYASFPIDVGILPSNLFVFKFSLVTWPSEQTTPVHGVPQIDFVGIFPTQLHPTPNCDLMLKECAKSHITAVSASTVGESVGFAVGFTVGIPVGEELGTALG